MKLAEDFCRICECIAFYHLAGCPNPNYDANTLTSTNQVNFYYTARMTLTCASGYSFQQQQIANPFGSVELVCGFGGEWETYQEIPICTRKLYNMAERKTIPYCQIISIPRFMIIIIQLSMNTFI